MARPRTITADDAEYAASVLLPKLQTFALHLNEPFSNRHAIQDLQEISDMRAGELKAEAMFVWCEKFLGDNEWTKLKAAIRKRRQRKLQAGQTEVVTVSKKAHALLRSISQRDNVTFSETLEYYLGLARKGKSRTRG